MLPSFDLEALPGEWWVVHGKDEALELTRELQREVPRGHVLHEAMVEAIAVKRHLKDVIFWLPERGQWAWVHLTYQVETDARWPTTFLTEAWSELQDELVS